jgi:hypothetical protein
MSMNDIESQISSFIRRRIAGARPVGVIKCGIGDGTGGFTGEVETGVLRRKKADVSEYLFGPHDGMSFFDLMHQLREASRALPYGPAYHCNIVIKNANVSFEYFWENASFSSVKELELDDRGSVPHFLLKRRFDQSLVRELTDFDVNNSLLFYVPSRVAEALPITDALMEVYATLEWQCDVNNGAMDQYFARNHDAMTGWKRSTLYGMTYRGLLRIQHKIAADIFAESIALYAHFHSRVEEARIELGIPAIAKQERSDIMERFYAISNSIEAARVRYIREHMLDLEQI